MEYKNPTPVVVGLVFPRPQELLLIRRKIEPHKGKFALPGGYVELGEDWRAALARELDQEASVIVSTDPEHMRVYDVRSTPDGEKILIFAVVEQEGVKKMQRFKQNDETSERKLTAVDDWTWPKLCFPLHTDVVVEYCGEHFATNSGGW